jgi:hypothetical protein
LRQRDAQDSVFDLDSYRIHHLRTPHLSGVLGDGLDALGLSVLGQLSGEDQAHSSLDLSGAQRGLLVGASQSSGLGGNAVEHIVNEGVDDLHRLGGEGQAGVNLLEGAVHVDGPGALGLAVGLLGSGFAGNSGLLGHG